MNNNRLVKNGAGFTSKIIDIYFAIIVEKLQLPLLQSQYFLEAIENIKWGFIFKNVNDFL